MDHPGQEILAEFDQRSEQRAPQAEERQAEQSPAELTPQQVQEGVEQLSQAVEHYQLNDAGAAQQLAYDLTAANGGDPGSVDAGALGSTMAKAVLSACQIFDDYAGNPQNLPTVSREAAQHFTGDFLRSFGMDPRTTQVDAQRFSNLVLSGTLNFISAAKAQGLNATMDRLNSAEAAEWFANELHQCFGQTGPVSREYALHLADAGGKYILGILQKLQQLQPAQSNNRRAASGSSRQARGGRRSAARFQSNNDIFDADTMDLYQREHGRL